MTGPALTFRDAAAADLPEIIAMYFDDKLGSGREIVTDPLPESYHRAFAEIDRRADTRLIVGELEGELVMTMQLDIIPGLSHGGARRMLVEAVRVASAHRGSGIGRRAMEWVIRLARAENCRMVQLTTNKARHRAHKFYEKLGFVASHEGMKLVLK